ncbi:hypothetical protein GN109_22750 [Collimonas pratensis]|uniref:hypothetical protein n=1 Tax=Collimonas pratensis TaxID=279113 RepID=UPI00143DD9EC|nr:hypothetical protein [Collimonas pratensis]NKI72250.1 hypothetical protein [Collimonas pratensis]
MKNIVSMAVSMTLAIAIVGGGIYLMSNSTHDIKTKSNPAKIEIQAAKHAAALETAQTARVMQRGEIVKCESGGKATYSDTPCPTSSHTETVAIHESSGGFVSPDKDTIADTRARIQAEIKRPGFVAMAGESSPALTSNTQGQCYYLAEEIKSIDSASNQRQSGWSQDQLRLRRLDVRNRMYRLGC